MTSLELHEYLTPEQHERWMSLNDSDYQSLVNLVLELQSSGKSIIESVNLVDKAYQQHINLDDCPF